MKNCKNKILTLASIFILVSCNNGQLDSTYVKVGFNEYYGASYPTSQVGLAFIGKRKQSLNVAFDVYVGARKGFADDWEKDLWECNPGYGKFAIHRSIEDVSGNEIQSDFFIINDFPNDEKYVLTYEKIEGSVDGLIMHYEGYVTNSIDFNSIFISKGSVGYYLCYYDDINQKIFEGNHYLYGISWGGKMNFEKIDDSVVFYE